MGRTKGFDITLGLTDLGILYSLLFVVFLLAGQWDISSGNKTFIEVFLMSAGFSFVAIVMIVGEVLRQDQDKW